MASPSFLSLTGKSVLTSNLNEENFIRKSADFWIDRPDTGRTKIFPKFSKIFLLPEFLCCQNFSWIESVFVTFFLWASLFVLLFPDFLFGPRLGGGGGRIRTYVDKCRQIYSLLPLTTRPPHRSVDSAGGRENAHYEHLTTDVNAKHHHPIKIKTARADHIRPIFDPSVIF